MERRNSGLGIRLASRSTGEWRESFSASGRVASMPSMAEAVPSGPRYSREEYFRLVEAGALSPDDRVELLEGVIVAMSPQTPRHASAVRRTQAALHLAVAGRAIVSVQLPLVAGASSVPEPDLAVLPGTHSDYDQAHPRTALLVVEVADSSIAQDRLTKAAIYARTGVLEYWIVNLRDDCVEVFRELDAVARRYGLRLTAARGEMMDLLAFGDVRIRVDDLLPARER